MSFSKSDMKDFDPELWETMDAEETRRLVR